MKRSLLKSQLEHAGARFEAHWGAEVPAGFSDIQTEYGYIRNHVGLTDFSHLHLYTIPEETGIDFLDEICAGNVAKIRFGRVLHTFIANKAGQVIADVYVANNDDELVICCESLVSENELQQIFDKHGSKSSGLKSLSVDHAALSLDGYKAWSVMNEVFGADVLGLPYLSIELFPFDGEEIRLIRAGKTSEFGYLLIIPQSKLNDIFSVLKEKVEKLEGGLCGLQVHNTLRLDGRFFNIYKEGAIVKDPLSLGLQWMIDFEKDEFLGADAILTRRKDGLKQKVIGFECDPKTVPPNGTEILHNAGKVGQVVAHCHSYTLGRTVGLALINANIAYAGLSIFKLDDEAGTNIRTLSMPPIIPKSLTVKLDEM